MKYVVFQNQEGDSAAVLLFPDTVVHADVRIRGRRAVSAGFVRFTSIGRPVPYGTSESLHLKAREEDARLIPDLGWYVGLLRARQAWGIPTLHIRPEVRGQEIVWCAWAETPVTDPTGAPIEGSHEDEVIEQLLKHAPRF